MLALLCLLTGCSQVSDGVSLAHAQTGPGSGSGAAVSNITALNSLSANVLVVYHNGVPESKDVAQHYARQRSIPLLHLCGVDFPAEDIIPGKHYLEAVKPAIRKCLERVDADRILYIVMSYRTPFKVVIPGQRFDAATDSLIADIWDQANPDPLPQQVRSPHPYFVAHDSAGNRYVPFVPLEIYREEGKPRIYSVWRLDGPSADLAKGLVDKAMQAEAKGGPRGKGCFDRNTNDVQYKADASYAAGEWDIQRASELVAAAGFAVTVDTSPEEFGQSAAVPRCEPTALYAGWYSLNTYYDGFQWTEGSIGMHIDSMSAWHPREGPNWVHNAISRGITITTGAVSEPYLANFPQADGFFHDLLAGANVGDALLRNSRLLKFRFLNVGDPLYRPFEGGRGPLATGQQPGPSVRVRSPRTLGGVPGVAIVHADGALSSQRTVRLSVHPSNLGTVESPLVFGPEEAYKEVRVQTAGVSEAKTLRILAEGVSGYASGAIQLLPALARLEPAQQEVPAGSPVDLRLQVGAVVHGAAAPVDLSTNCARYLNAPAKVMVPPGQDWVQFTMQTKAVERETPCEVTLSKFGASISARVVLTPNSQPE